MSSADLMTDDELKQWVLRRLGAPLVKVELDADHVQDALEGAKRWFAAKKGVKKQCLVPFYSGKPDYVLGDDVNTVIDVAFPQQANDLATIFSPFLMVDQQVPYDVFAAPNSAGLYSTLTQTLQYVEMAKRVLGADQQWRQDGHTLWLFPTPRMSGNVLIDYTSHQFTVDQLNERDHDMLKRYMLALARLDLGTIRSKYSEVPGSQGSIKLDGERLIDSAEKAIEEMDKEIILSGYPMEFFHG